MYAKEEGEKMVLSRSGAFMLTAELKITEYVYHGACTTVLNTDTPSSEHCPVLSKCIL